MKTHVELPWVLVLELGISKGCNTILLNFQGWNFVFSGISKGKVPNLKFPGGVSENYILNPHCLVFFLEQPIAILDGDEITVIELTMFWNYYIEVKGIQVKWIQRPQVTAITISVKVKVLFLETTSLGFITGMPTLTRQKSKELTLKLREYKIKHYNNLKSQLLQSVLKFKVLFLEATSLGFITDMPTLTWQKSGELTLVIW